MTSDVHRCSAEEPEAPEAGQSRRDLLPRRHTIAGSRPVLRHSDAMDLDVSQKDLAAGQSRLSLTSGLTGGLW